MRSLVLTLTVALGLVLAVFIISPTARAQLEDVCDTAPSSQLCAENQQTSGGAGSTRSNIYTLLNNVAQIVSLLAGIAGVVMIMLGGFQYITSGGDSSKTAQAQNTILYALIGLVVAATAQLIVIFVLDRV